MWFYITIGMLIGSLIASIVTSLVMLLKIDSQCVGVIKVYSDSTDGSEYMFCDLDQDMKYIKSQRRVIFFVKNETTHE